MEAGSQGLKVDTIKNKYSLRMVQNGDIYLKDVFVPDNMRLENAHDFSSTSLILAHSRMGVGWLSSGIAAGAYEAALRYAMKRK